MFDKMERVESTLYIPCRNLRLKNFVTLGRKSRTESKIDSVWMRNYNSKKYNDHESLSVVNIDTSDFLIFNYSDNEGFSDIFISYPHMENLITRLDMLNEVLKTNEDLFFEEEGQLYFNAEFNDLVVRVEGLVNDKSIILYPDVVEDRDGNPIAGVVMVLGSEEYSVTMDFNAYSGLVYYLKNFNLHTSSQNLLNSALMVRLLNGGNTPTNNNNQTNSPESTPVLNLGRNSMGKQRTINNDNMNKNAVRKPSEAVYIRRNTIGTFSDEDIELKEQIEETNKEFNTEDTYPWDVNDDEVEDNNVEDLFNNNSSAEEVEEDDTEVVVKAPSLLINPLEILENAKAIEFPEDDED